MKNIQGIEGFTRGFLDFYRVFIKDLEKSDFFKNENPVMNESVKVKEKTQYISLGAPLQLCTPQDEDITFRGTYEPLLKKQTELIDIVEGLKKANDVDCKLYFQFLNGVGLPHYDLFLNSIRFPVSDFDDIYITPDFDDMGGAFDPSYDLLNTVMLSLTNDLTLEGTVWDKNTLWLVAENPDRRGSIQISDSIGDGYFFYDKETVFTMPICRKIRYSDGPKESCYTGSSIEEFVSFDINDVPNGALTSFLELIKPIPDKYR